MTICNMSIEAGARAGMIAPDDTTFAYLEGRPGAPKGAEWERRLDEWRALPSDPDAAFDREVEIDVGELAPQVTWGTNPGMVAPVDGRVPDPADLDDPDDRAAAERALAYMALEPGTPIAEIRVDRVFIGSCTNARIEDLRVAAEGRGRPARRPVRAGDGRAGLGGGQAAGRGGRARRDLPARRASSGACAGCSMCLGMNPDVLAPGERCASTSNRNFEGRQGRGGRTHLVSPAMAAAAALAGRFVDVRELDVEAVARREAVPDDDRAGRGARPCRRRHRPDHPEAVPEADRADRLRRVPLLRLAAGAGLRAEPARVRGSDDPRRRPQLRLRLLARARRLGAPGLRLRGGHRARRSATSSPPTRRRSASC